MVFTGYNHQQNAITLLLTFKHSPGQRIGELNQLIAMEPLESTAFPGSPVFFQTLRTHSIGRSPPWSNFARGDSVKSALSCPKSCRGYCLRCLLANRRELVAQLRPRDRENCSAQRLQGGIVVWDSWSHGLAARGQSSSIPRKKKEGSRACGCA